MSALGADLQRVHHHLTNAEQVCANGGPSPVLVEIRAALEVVNHWLDGALNTVGDAGVGGTSTEQTRGH